MADFTRRTETAQRNIISLDLPTNITELLKAANAAHNDAAMYLDQVYDDSVIVEADDEEIRFIVFTKEWGKP